MAQKNISSHLLSIPGPSGSSGRVRKRGKGTRLPTRARQVVEAVRTFFEKEKATQRSILRNQVVNRTAQACKISPRTVERIHDEFRSSSGLPSSPEKRYEESRVRVVVDDYNVDAIRKEVHAFYARKEYPTLDSLLGVVRSKALFSGSRTTLWKVLHEMGFRNKKHENKNYIYEQPRVIQQRHDFLRRLRRN